MTRRRRTVPPRRMVYWALRTFGPCPDLVLERVLWRMTRLPGSTVRGARHALVEAGLVVESGRTGDGRIKWELAKPAAQSGAGAIVAQQELF